MLQSFRKISWFITFTILYCGHCAVATQITFPPETPGLQENKNDSDIVLSVVLSKIKYASAGQRFFHFNINGNNIFFPLNGEQPTIKQAVEWSCAHIIDPKITKWYMAMFGCKDSTFVEEGTNIDNGYDSKTNNPVPIVQTDDPLVWLKFKEIASNPVGRILLYRLLIEMRRPQTVAEGNSSRSWARCIEIKHEADWTYLPAASNSECSKITLASRRTEGLLVQQDTQNPEILCLCPVIKQKENELCSLFHEMLHWYHHLRNEQRYNSETSKEATTITETEYPISLAYKKNLGQHPEQYKYWSAGPQIKIQEMRVICGDKPTNYGTYQEGDDLSENVFRASVKAPMRFGHNWITQEEVLDEINRKAVLVARGIAQSCLFTIFPSTPELKFYTSA